MKAIHRFREFGGVRLVRQYARMGMLGTAVREGLAWMMGRDRNVAYANVARVANRWLVERYRDVAVLDCEPLPGHEPKRRRVWQCWLQGMEQRPELVRQCMESQRLGMPDCEFVEITEENCTQWVPLPQEILEKRRRGIIPAALFSDILRMELLTRYGGVWMDGSVLCTLDGAGAMSDIKNDKHHREKVERILECEAFVMRYFRDGKVTGIGNWMMAGVAGNELTRRTRDRLIAYWMENDAAVNYYMCHAFLGMAMEECPELTALMPRGNAYPCTRMGTLLEQRPLTTEEWQQLTHNACFHKLNFRLVVPEALGW